MSNIIHVNQLKKDFRIMKHQKGAGGALRNLIAPSYRLVHAVDNVHLDVEEGEMVGYLGPNGAGKSTTLKILTGLLVPTQGEVVVNGFTPWKNRASYVAHIGAVFGQRTTLWWDLPVIDSLNLIQTIYNVPSANFRRNLDEFIGLLEMESFLQTPVRSLSLGQRMRSDLCAALLHEPRILFLDEPTIGLDVVAKERIRQFILHVNQQLGTTVLLTTHDLADVERLCERVVILDAGKIVYDGRLTALANLYEGDHSLWVTFSKDYSDVSLPGFPPPDREGIQAVYYFDHREISAPELIQSLIQRFQVADLEVRRPLLEETIRRIYEEKLLTQ
jgi:ABC-2 type transport system ATP-binding protein